MGCTRKGSIWGGELGVYILVQSFRGSTIRSRHLRVPSPGLLGNCVVRPHLLRPWSYSLGEREGLDDDIVCSFARNCLKEVDIFDSGIPSTHIRPCSGCGVEDERTDWAPDGRPIVPNPPCCLVPILTLVSLPPSRTMGAR